MNQSRAPQTHNHHQTQLQTLQLLQLHQYQELCYQLYLLALATSESKPKDLSHDQHYKYDAYGDGFISRESVCDEDGLIYCMLEWESREHQEKFQEYTLSRTDEKFQKLFAELGCVMNMESLSREFLDIL